MNSQTCAFGTLLFARWCTVIDAVDLFMDICLVLLSNI